MKLESSYKSKCGWTWVLRDIKDYNGDHVFDCGQCFRWRRAGEVSDSWRGIAAGKAAAMDYDPKAKTLTVQSLFGTGKKADLDSFWAGYLDLDRDYGKIKRTLSRNDAVMKEAIGGGVGIRILHQDLWETIVSFIISQNNNIPRIKGCIEKLAKISGEQFADEDQSWQREMQDLVPYTLPTPEKLAALKVDDLAPVKLGYRAAYLIKAAQEVCERGMPVSYDDLIALTGVGPKVANCINLFGLSDYSSFPIDVWVKRVMSKLYDFDESDTEGMRRYAEEHFGELSGFAQQYLFYYIRNEKN